MFEKYPFFKGVGEIFSRHDDLTNLTIGETPRMNHPALYEVFKFCAERELPVCVHHNSTSVASSLSPNTQDDDYIYLHELTEVLDVHSDCDFVWVHCGVSRRVRHDKYFEMVANVLERYPRLYVDVSWVVYENMICDLVDGKLVPNEQWIDKVILPFSDRIMLGSDKTGYFEDLGKTMAMYNGLLEILPDDAREKVAYGNAERLYFK